MSYRSAKDISSEHKAIPLRPLRKAELDGWLQLATAAQREWVEASGLRRGRSGIAVFSDEMSFAER